MIFNSGPNVKVMRKAKLSVHAADVKGVLRQYSIDVPASSKDDLVEDQIVVRLRKVSRVSQLGSRVTSAIHYRETLLMHS